MAGQTLKKIALTALLVLFPAVGWTGALDRGPMQQRYNPAAESMIRVPGVVGLDEQQALSILQQAGLTVRVRYETFEKNGLAGKEFTVIDQEPGTAGVAMLGSTVTITVYTPPGAVQPGHYGQGGYGDNGGYGGYQQQPDGYYDDGSGGYQQQPGGYGDGGNQQQGGYDEYGNPLPAEQAPVPWGGGGQPAGGSRLPAESLPAEAPAQPAAPVVNPDLTNDVRAVPPPAETPAEPVVATPVPPGVTPAQPEPAASRPSPVGQRLDEKVPPRVDIRARMKGVEKKIAPQVGPAASPAGQPAAPATTSSDSGPGSSNPEPVQATPVRPALTPVTQQGGTQSSRAQTFQATPVLPTATAVRGTGVTATQSLHVDGECRSWSQVSTDIYQHIEDEIRRIASKTTQAASNAIPIPVESIDGADPVTQYVCSILSRLNHSGDRSSGSASGVLGYGECLTEVTDFAIALPNVLVNFWNSHAGNSWSTIGPRQLIPNQTHKGRLISTGGRVFITPYPINSDSITLSLKKISGRARTGVTVCSYDDDGNQTKLWSFQADRGRDNKGQLWTRTFTGVGAKIISVHLDSKSATDTFQYELRAEIPGGI